VAAEGGKSEKAKLFHGIDGGVFEIASRHRGDAFRVLYAVKIDTDIWVLHAFQKKSKSGIKTPRMEVDVVHDRLKRLKEALK
jgi:phage-related protein